MQLEDRERRNNVKHPKRLRNKDIMNYIKDMEQNCCVSDDDEDCADAKGCSVRFSRERTVGSSEEPRSTVMLRKNKGAISFGKEVERPSVRNNVDTCICRSSRESRSCGHPGPVIKENSRNSLHATVDSIRRYRKPLSKRDLYNYHELSPRFHDQCFGRGRKFWPTNNEVSSVIVKDRSRRIFPDLRIDGPSITGGKRTKARMFGSLRRRKQHNDSTYNDVYSSLASGGWVERNLCYCDREKTVSARAERLNEESDVDNLAGQRRRDNFYPVRNTAAELAARSRRVSSEKGDYTSERRRPARRSKLSTCRGLLHPRSNGLTTSTRSLESTSSPASQRRILRWKNQMVPSLKTSSAIMGASIGRCYRQAREYKNNMDQRGPSVLEGRGSLCCRKPGLLRGSRKPCGVLHTRQRKEWLGCCCEGDVKREEADRCKYCCCLENVNGPTRGSGKLRRESTRRPVGTSDEASYVERDEILRETSKSVQWEINSTEASNLSTGESPLDENTLYNDANRLYNDSAFDESELSVGERTRSNSGDLTTETESEDLGSRVFPLLNDRPYRAHRSRGREVAWLCKKLSNDLKSGQRVAMKAPRHGVLREGITRAHPSAEELFYEMGIPKKLVSDDFSRLEHDTVESPCECEELVCDSSVACLIDSRARVKGDETLAKNRIFACCCCCTSTSHDENDPVKKLESFCEKVKALNKDISHKPSRSVCYNSMRTNAQRYPYDRRNDRDQSKISIRLTAIQTARRPTEREWSADSVRLKLGKSKHRHGDTSLDLYPSRGEDGSPLTLRKKSVSAADCQETNEEYDSTVDYG